MKRIEFYLTEKQIDALKARKNATGIPVSELVRRAIDAFLKKQPRKR